MIETILDCENFKLESDGDWIVHVVPVEEDVHPLDTSLSILFIKVLSTGKTYYFAFDHPDSIPSITASEFIDKYLLPAKNIKWALNKKSFMHLLPLTDVYDINYCNFTNRNQIFDLQEFDTTAHSLIRRNSNGFRKINKSIPLMKHLESFNDLCAATKKLGCKLDVSMKLFNDVIIETLRCLETSGIYVDKDKFEKYFNVKPNKRGLIFSQYNFYTSTGRPSNSFQGVNYAALNSKDGSRSSFISRYGKDGKIVVIDYTTFHPRIICMLTQYDIPVEIDIYEYLAKLYFQKQNIDEMDKANAKQITFKQLYGAVESKYAHIKYLSNLRTYINKQWNYFKENGYVCTPIFKRKITDKHITDPNPTKVFNYILQAVEGEIALSRLQEIQHFLMNKKTKAVLYTYDAVIYDFHKEDGIDTLNHIRNTMSIDGKFPMKTYIGNSYQTIKQILI